MNQLLRGYCLLLSLFTFLNVSSQHLPITNYSSKEANSPLGTASIFQDKQGWIWFTNGYEVVRYDGHRFKLYPPAHDINIDYLFGLMEVKNELWVLGEPGSMKISGDSVTLLDAVDPELSFQACIQHKNKTFLLEESAIYVYDGKSVERASRKIPHKFSTKAGLIPYGDSLLLSYDSYGSLFVFNLNTGSSTSINMKITDMQKGLDGTILILSNANSFHKLNNIIGKGSGYEVSTSVFYTPSEKQTNFNRFVIDQSGNVWAIEPLKRLVRISPDAKFTSYTEEQGLPGLAFHDLLVDRENNLWIGYTAGAYKINTGLWERLTKSEGLILNHVTLMVRDGENIFLGTQEGLHLYRNGIVSKLMEGDKLFNCNSLLALNNRLWYNHGPDIYTAMLYKTNSEIMGVTKLASLPPKTQVNDLKLDQKGTLFIGTSSGLYALIKGKLTKAIPDSSHLRKIIVDKSNHLWLGKFIAGVDHYAIQYNNDELILVKVETLQGSENVPPLEKIRAIDEDKQGNIVVGTRYNGLFYVTVTNGKASSIKHFGINEGLNSKNIWGISSSNGGKIWVSTAKGLNSIKPTLSGFEVLDEGKSREIFGTSGVLFDEFRQRVWTINDPGVIYFDSDSKIPFYPFQVFLSVRRPGSRQFEMPETVKEFRYNENNFSFELAANTYENEKSIQFAYKLVKNGNEEWSQPSTIPSLNFFSLNPGKYELRVKAVNSFNQWSSNEAVYAFTILPPFWQQSWFLILSVLAISSGLYLLYRYRINQMKELFEMRQVIASDLHDEIGSSLTSIHILSKMSQVNVSTDQQKAHSLLEKVIDQSSQIQQNMSDIVWAIRPDNDKMQNMVMRMREYLSHSLEQKNIKIDFKADETLMHESLPLEQRRDLLLIFKEAINNIIKYSQCKSTNIRLERNNGNIRMLIEDDGVGFDLNPQRTSSGIMNMQRRAGLMKGILRIDSAIGKGTRIELLIPIT